MNGPWGIGYDANGQGYHRRITVANDFPPKYLPLSPPLQPEPGGTNAFPSLLPEFLPSGAPRTQGNDVRTVVPIVANLTSRRTPGAAGRSTPELPRTPCGAPP